MPEPARQEVIDPEGIGERLPDTVSDLRAMLVAARVRAAATRDTPDMRRAQSIERRIHELSALNASKGTEWYAGLPWWPGYR
ncbi:MAG: hypothetical protein H6842_09415 [Rhodospirillaceae bacterium]|nr:hypothetical protein [Rhodospirillaceae bacterium]